MESKLKGDELKDELSTTAIKPTLMKRLDSAIRIDSVPINQLQTRERENPEDGDCNGGGSKKKLLEMQCQDSQKSNVEETEEEEDTKKGSVALDEYIPDEVKSQYHVLQQGDEIYDATLNLRDVEGNNNEFYIIQALESNEGSTFMVYNRWGRVGMKGEDKLHGPYTCVESALDEFKKNLHEKAKNYLWARYKQFVPDTKLDERVAEFISLIRSASIRVEQLMASGYDAEMLPLDKLSEALISKKW